MSNLNPSIVIPDKLKAINIKRWNPNNVIEFLKANRASLHLDDDDINLIQQNKITGFSLHGLTEERLLSIGLPLGPATGIIELIKELMEEKGIATVESGRFTIFVSVYF